VRVDHSSIPVDEARMQFRRNEEAETDLVTGENNPGR
jgi:hypothetical protein